MAQNPSIIDQESAIEDKKSEERRQAKLKARHIETNYEERFSSGENDPDHV